MTQNDLSRIKNSSLPLLYSLALSSLRIPWAMYVHSDQRATGLIHLLSLALRVLTMLEWRCRQRLADQHESVAGLYAGNPKRTTRRPTAEALLQAFRLIHLSVVTLGQQTHRHMTPLSEVQQRILVLLGVSPALYERLAAESLKPT